MITILFGSKALMAIAILQLDRPLSNREWLLVLGTGSGFPMVVGCVGMFFFAGLHSLCKCRSVCRAGANVCAVLMLIGLLMIVTAHVMYRIAYGSS